MTAPKPTPWPKVIAVTAAKRRKAIAAAAGAAVLLVNAAATADTSSWLAFAVSLVAAVAVHQVRNKP